MTARKSLNRSVTQRVMNRGRELGLSRNDALVAYAMDRLLYRLGRSSQAGEFFLKGGVLVANLVDAPHRFTRDIDLLRRHGPTDLDELRHRFRTIVAVSTDDGVDFDSSAVRATLSTREVDGYDGVRVRLGATIGDSTIDVQIDIGFGDAVVPPAARLRLTSFLDDDPSAEVLAYDVGPVLAEKIETLVTKFPLVEHRLKDLLDVVVLSQTKTFEGAALLSSILATFERRGAAPDLAILDDITAELRGRRWSQSWAVMLREKAVTQQLDLTSAVAAFDAFVRPVFLSMATGHSLGNWTPSSRWKVP